MESNTTSAYREAVSLARALAIAVEDGAEGRIPAHTCYAVSTYLGGRLLETLGDTYPPRRLAA